MCSDPFFPDAHAVRGIVLDTNIVLDAFVFNDPATQPLKLALASRKIQWIATKAMRDELARVLAYPKIVVRLALYQLSAADVLAQFDGQAQWLDAAPKASVTCRDPDDQKFIDLAVANKAMLLSKDRAVLCMAKRLLALDVRAHTATVFVV
ncbi:putative toxin-antitoxin system toxin component, PIN family [Rhodoferax ferrireducens]|uniref:putative toxin-antitoxin system toxin component, PIN family n=1 Tax=Rhodoferax ferrireducens TaxID=192843 RepID=UPI003BB66720